MVEKTRLLMVCAVILTALLFDLGLSQSPFRPNKSELSPSNTVSTIGVQNRYAPADVTMDPRVRNFVFPPIKPRPDEPPDEPSNPVPSSGATEISTSASLSVSVTHPLGDVMSVAFYEDPIAAPENFSIIALPDTQIYARNYSDIFANQTRWIANTKDALNTVFVTHEGDIVHDWRPEIQWQRANSSMSLLDGIVPWAVLPGNHDGAQDGNMTNYGMYFGYDRFADYDWYGGAYEDDNNTNSYELFSGGSDKYLILHMQYAPDEEVLAWANATVDSYPDRRVILTTHSYLNTDGSRTGSGKIIWEEFVKYHADQIFLVLCGHVPGEGRRTDIVDGHVVYQVLADYQNEAYGGNGKLRILSFHPKEARIYVTTYSPYCNTYDMNSTSQFSLDYSMTCSSQKPTVIGRVENVASGQRASIQWNGLEYNSTYRWFAVATDRLGKSTASVIWNFTTTGHDLKITSVSPTKTLVCKGYPLSINVTVINQGIFPEMFTLSIYGNTTRIAKEEDILLPIANSVSISVELNTSSWETGHWILTGTVETNLSAEKANSIGFVLGVLLVTIPGDISPPYGSVDILDVARVAIAYGSTPDSPNWNPNADIDDNGIIDVFDVSIIADHFGQTGGWG